MFTAGEVFLFIFGLVPQYVSFWQVEKHFTNFWTGFWNIYGLIQVLASLVMGTDDLTLRVVGTILIMILASILYLVLHKNWGNVARNLGASIMTTSLSWGSLIWFVSSDFQAGFVVGALHLIGMIVIHYGLRSR